MGSYNSEEEAIACYNWRNENKVGYVLVPLYNFEHEEIGTFMHKIGKSLYSGVITLEEFMEAKAQGWPCKNGSTPIRPCLKIGGMPNGERFFRQSRQIFAGGLTPGKKI